MKEVIQILRQLSDINKVSNEEQKNIGELNNEIEKFKKSIEEEITISRKNIAKNDSEIDIKIVSINFEDIFNNNQLDVNEFIGNKFTFNFGEGFNEISGNENKYEQILKFLFIVNDEINSLEENIYVSIDRNNERFRNLYKEDGVLGRLKEFNKYNNPYNIINKDNINSITFDLGGLKLDNGKFKGDIEIYINDVKDRILMFRISKNILTELHNIGSSMNLAFSKDYDLIY